MTYDEILFEAHELGILAEELKKDELIRVIQFMEGRFPCFQDSLFCSQKTCRWQEECTALMTA